MEFKLVKALEAELKGKLRRPEEYFKELTGLTITHPAVEELYREVTKLVEFTPRISDFIDPNTLKRTLPLRRTMSFVERFLRKLVDQKPGGAVFVEPYGSGKTHMLGIATMLIYSRGGKEALERYVNERISVLEEHFGESLKENLELLRKIKEHLESFNKPRNPVFIDDRSQEKAVPIRDILLENLNAGKLGWETTIERAADEVSKYTRVVIIDEYQRHLNDLYRSKLGETYVDAEREFLKVLAEKGVLVVISANLTSDEKINGYLEDIRRAIEDRVDSPPITSRVLDERETLLLLLASAGKDVKEDAIETFSPRILAPLLGGNLRLFLRAFIPRIIAYIHSGSYHRGLRLSIGTFPFGILRAVSDKDELSARAVMELEERLARLDKAFVYANMALREKELEEFDELKVSLKAILYLNYARITSRRLEALKERQQLGFISEREIGRLKRLLSGKCVPEDYLEKLYRDGVRENVRKYLKDLSEDRIVIESTVERGRPCYSVVSYFRMLLEEEKTEFLEKLFSGDEEFVKRAFSFLGYNINNLLEEILDAAIMRLIADTRIAGVAKGLLGALNVKLELSESGFRRLARRIRQHFASELSKSRDDIGLQELNEMLAKAAETAKKSVDDLIEDVRVHINGRVWTLKEFVEQLNDDLTTIYESIGAASKNANALDLRTLFESLELNVLNEYRIFREAVKGLEPLVESTLEKDVGISLELRGEKLIFDKTKAPEKAVDTFYYLAKSARTLAAKSLKTLLDTIAQRYQGIVGKNDLVKLISKSGECENFVIVVYEGDKIRKLLKLCDVERLEDYEGAYVFKRDEFIQELIGSILEALGEVESVPSAAKLSPKILEILGIRSSEDVDGDLLTDITNLVIKRLEQRISERKAREKIGKEERKAAKAEKKEARKTKPQPMIVDPAMPDATRRLREALKKAKEGGWKLRIEFV